MTLANKELGDPTAAGEPDSAAAQPNRRRIAANFVTLASTSVLGLIVTIVISIYVRRALGPAAIGQVSWALAAVLAPSCFPIANMRWRRSRISASWSIRD